MKKSRLISTPAFLLFILLLFCLMTFWVGKNAFSFTTNVTDGCKMRLGETKEICATLQNRLPGPCSIYYAGLNPIQIYVVEVDDSTALATHAISNEAEFEAYESKTTTYRFVPEKAGQYRFIAKAEITLNYIKRSFYEEYLIDVVE